MKQTPIPEKIDKKFCSIMSEGTVDYFNSLIDVLTEQQKKIDKNDAEHVHLQAGMGELRRRIQALEDSNAKQPPYTAMRSTGDKIADEQENRGKQMKEDMRIVLDEFWMNGKEAGYLMKYDNVITTDKIIDRILSIVKGE